MFHQLLRYDNNWRNHHRRYMDEPSLIKLVIIIAILLAMLIFILAFIP